MNSLNVQTEFDLNELRYCGNGFLEDVKEEQKYRLAREFVSVLSDGRPRCIQMESREELSQAEGLRGNYQKIISTHLIYGFLNPFDAEVGDSVYHLAMSHVYPQCRGEKKVKVSIPISQNIRLDDPSPFYPLQTEERTFVKRSDLWWERIA